MSERPTGLTRDVGWEVGASRRLPLAPEALWAFLLSPEGLACWLGPGLDDGLQPGARYATADGTSGEVRSLRPGERVRLSWRPPDRPADAVLQVALRPVASGCSVTLHAERLADAAERERVREAFRAALDAVAEAVG